MSNIITTKNLIKTYENGKVQALRGVDLEIKEGDFVSIMGPSGSGKSTLLHMIGALDRPTEGEVVIDKHNLIDIKNLDTYRARTIGFIFQLHNLIPSLTALENVLVPMFALKKSRKYKRHRAEKLLKLVGLADRINFLPPKLSGGERQRIAIARALANKPKIILADEPTGDIDTANGKKIMGLLEKINSEEKTTLVVVTHDPEVGKRARHQCKMIDGKIQRCN